MIYGGMGVVRLREMRVRSLFSIRGLASAAGISDKTIRGIESGQRRPSLATIRKVSSILQIDPAEIDEFKEAMNRAINEE